MPLPRADIILAYARAVAGGALRRDLGNDVAEPHLALMEIPTPRDPRSLAHTVGDGASAMVAGADEAARATLPGAVGRRLGLRSRGQGRHGSRRQRQGQKEHFPHRVLRVWKRSFVLTSYGAPRGCPHNRRPG